MAKLSGKDNAKPEDRAKARDKLELAELVVKYAKLVLNYPQDAQEISEARSRIIDKAIESHLKNRARVSG